MEVGTVLIAHPSPDLYGADLQMLQTVEALVESGWRVVVTLPTDGPLVARLRGAGADISFVNFPVLRRADLHPRKLLTLVGSAVASLPKSVRLLRRLRASLLIVNTVTLPWWLLAGKFARTPILIHVHEAESQAGRLVRTGLLLPLRLADSIIVISQAALGALTEVQPSLLPRCQLIYNGVEGPPSGVDISPVSPPRLLVVGRLAPHKAQHLALEVLALLRADGYDVELELAGTTFAGKESYESGLRERAARPDVSTHVYFSGYCSPVWPVLARATILLAPALQEPLGNVVIEAHLAQRPVVASAVQGHKETIANGVTGVLVPPGDPTAMANAARRLLDDVQWRDGLAQAAAKDAGERFSVSRYRSEISTLAAEVAHRTR